MFVVQKLGLEYSIGWTPSSFVTRVTQRRTHATS